MSSNSAALDAAETLTLRALAEVMADDVLGPRFLDLTGLDVATLRGRAAEPAVLAALVAFLENHEPSLVAIAHALIVQPAALVAAGQILATA